ncbi:monovalent cation/H(+) antiporter subunit G [Streptomyces sp. TRM66268-LWL]|uniref:Monovalent cation/H(+) antiporter subunit G n=1 Tax=Streptomyces polyasparticus TaxID=2767826 RepID=A0ABR7S7G0_9ACTN|nr:DUF6114 domain-containing protein [Streptomyces polyasparticus]MBC9711412.1 monovalent cation/H(+) antiporter subunit G [Streptomyces polyasparticus]
MSAVTPGPNDHFLKVYWRKFRTWRGSRPFWAGFFTILGGIPIAYFPYASMKLGNLTMSMATTAGAGSLIIGVLLITLGLTMWFHHIVRVFAGVAAILLALISIPVSNLGGFLIGFLLSMVGGALSISWVPDKKPGELEAEQSETVPGPRTDDDADGTMGEPDTTLETNGGRHSAG